MKLGIIGTGKIIAEALYAILPIKEIELSAIFARPHSREKGKEIAEKHNIPLVYTDYDELLNNSDIDTVYIGLVNNVHYEYAKKALQKGKHVILEKPFTGTYSEAKELMETAKAYNCFIFEAVTVLHNDVIDKMRDILPKLGTVRMFMANYSQYSSRYDRYLAKDVDPSFSPEHLGGALRDINVYNIHYAVALLGAPKGAHYYPNVGFNGIDTSGTLIMEYDGFSAICTGAKDSDSPCFVCIQGEKGYIKINGKPSSDFNLTISIVDDDKNETVRDGAGAMVRCSNVETFIPPVEHHRMTKEFQDFVRIIDEKNYDEADYYMKETLEVMRVLEECT